MKNIVYMIFLSVLIVSCGQRETTALQNREEQLVKKEHEFAQKESEYDALLAMRDSLRASQSKQLKPDTIVQRWPDSIAGQWNSRLVCRSSNCNNYVIGDQRNEQWQFVADATGIYVKTYTKNKTMRLFKGSLLDNRISLVQVQDSMNESRARVQMNLDLIGSKIMRGTQTVGTNGDCEANFSIELTRIER
ncbi:hypothetical protein [Sphingobacterium sp. UBA3549]|uniref:hypothetical protein n=2 Tax=unclassified Sphingobacterium TaxID=2609468 RepID=UPI0025CE2182|nr:hypothetical protein [Sphingobacterium sp. UBA3549]